MYKNPAVVNVIIDTGHGQTEAFLRRDTFSYLFTTWDTYAFVKVTTFHDILYQFLKIHTEFSVCFTFHQLIPNDLNTVDLK